MRFALLLCLIGAGTATIPSAPASPSKAKTAPPEISQLVVTQYTGSDDAKPHAEPIYRILLRRDGTAIYVGNKTYMKRTGRYHGKVEPDDFLRLAKLFQQNSFQNWERSYNAYNDRHVAREKLEITYGKQKKTIVAYEGSGPQAIRRASKIAYGLLWKIRWQKVTDSDVLSN